MRLTTTLLRGQQTILSILPERTLQQVINSYLAFLKQSVKGKDSLALPLVHL